MCTVGLFGSGDCCRGVLGEVSAGVPYSAVCAGAALACPAPGPQMCGGTGNGGSRVVVVRGTIPPARGRGGNGGSQHRPPRGSRGPVFFDAANITTWLYRANGGQADAAVRATNLVRLREGLRARYAVGKFWYVVAGSRDKDRSRLEIAVARSGWRFLEAWKPSMINRDPADVSIQEGILAARSQLAMTGPTTVVLISHDGGFQGVCQSFLDGGGHLVLAGFVGGFSARLYALTSHDRCEILDLRYDLGAVDPIAPTQHRTTW